MVVGTVETDQALVVDVVDDALHIRFELPGLRIHFVSEVADIAAQGAACDVLGIRAGEQTEVHLLVFAEVMQQAGRLVDHVATVVAIGLATVLTQGRIGAGAHFHAQVVVGDGACRLLHLHRQAPCVVACALDVSKGDAFPANAVKRKWTLILIGSASKIGRASALGMTSIPAQRECGTDSHINSVVTIDTKRQTGGWDIDLTRNHGDVVFVCAAILSGKGVVVLACRVDVDNVACSAQVGGRRNLREQVTHCRSIARHT
ncbi:hypothetical protein SDC9_104049 [bioreactor metagenome]|uniref:Uncharacterized protein n=1 Tax=bioreactor metagenome TaxID=1076179 RepID=A0A645AVQ7_9ZZZZ